MNFSILLHLLLLSYFDIDYLLKLAHQFSLVAYSIVIAVGVTQGLILGGAIIERFPKMLSHTRLTSMMLFLLFAANAIASVMNFAQPEKISISQIFASQTPSELVSIIFQLIGINTGAGTIIAFSTTLLIFIILKFTTLKAHTKVFIIVISAIMIIITSILRLSDYTPTNFEIFLYMLYQAGMTGGIIWGTRRKISSDNLRLRYFRERWIG